MLKEKDITSSEANWAAMNSSSQLKVGQKWALDGEIQAWKGGEHQAGTPELDRMENVQIVHFWQTKKM